MDNLAADFEINPNNPLNAEYELGEGACFDCSFELFASGTVWGNIDGDINNQTDLINLLNTKVDLTDFNELSTTVTNNYNELTGDIADLTTTVTDNYNTLSGQISDLTSTVNDNYTSLDNRLTTAEGSILDLTDTVNDNYTELNGKITTTNNNLRTLSQTVEDNNTAINNRVDGIVDSLEEDISDLNDAIDNLSDTVSDNYTNLNGKITDNTDDITTIQNTINSYGDIVSYNAAYFATANQGALADTSLQPNDNITLLNNNAGYITISALDGYATEDYVNNQGFITADALNGYATEQWVNNKGYITGIDNSDVVTALGYIPYNASNPAGYITAASLPTVNNNTITIQKNGVNVDSFTLNQNSNKSINITVPTNNNELTNGAGYITSADLPTLADLTTTAQLEAINSGATSTKIGQIATNTQNIADEVTNRQNADNGLQSQIDAIVSSSDVFDIVGTYAELQAYDISTVPVNDIIKVLVDSTHSNAATYYRCVESGGVKSWSYIGSEGAYYTKSEADGRFVAQTITVNGQPLSSNVTLTASDVGALPDSTVIPTVNNSTITIQKNSTTVDTFTLNQSSAKTINISVPTDTSDLTNGAGYITNSALTNYVTTDTAQNISGRKTFLGEKAIYFKQNATSDKLGFTLYNPSNAELGALEWRPNTIGSNALLALNCPQSGSNYVGFRYWGNINIIAPRPTTNGNYYIPVNLTDGTNTVTANNNGTLNISTLLPDLSNYVTNTSLATTLADYTLASSLSTVATTGDYDDLTNKPTIPDISNLANKDLSNLSSTGNSKFQTPLVSGTNIKTINNTSLLGNGDISVLQNTATGNYSLTVSGTASSYQGAINIGVNSTIGGDGGVALGYGASASAYGTTALGGNAIASGNSAIQIGMGTNSTSNSLSVGFNNAETNYQLLDGATGLIPDARISSNIARTSAIPTQASDISAADTTLSNVSSIDSNSAVQTALDGKADTSLSNLSATGKTVIDGQWVNSYLSIASGESGTSSYSKNFSLSSYLPNDGKNYEVLLCCGGRTGTTTGNSIQIWIGSDIMATTLVAYGVTRTSNYFVTGGAVTLPVGTSRKITLALTSSGGTCSSVWVQAKGYRRIGTNS